jgi:hypothetical protein
MLPMPNFINVDSIRLEEVDGFPGPPGSHFRLPSGKVFGFPWKPDSLYRSGEWIIGRSLSGRPGRALYIAHDIENGGVAWSIDIAANSQCTVEANGSNVVIDGVHAKFDRPVRQVLQYDDGYWVVLDYNASIERSGNVAFVTSSGHVRWVSGKSAGERVSPYLEIRIGNGRLVEAWAERYMAVIDPVTLAIVATRP